MSSMRPNAGERRLQANQYCELVISSRDGANKTVIYQTNELIEAPNWSSDGKWLVYNGDGRLFRISVDGAIGPERINSAPVENLNNDHVIAPDGKRIYLSANDGHLYVMPFTGGVPQRVSNEQAPERQFRYFLHGISPDGRSLAYVAFEQTADGRFMTRIATIPAHGGEDCYLTDGKCPVDGAEYAADGQWIYFNSEANAKVDGHAQLFRMRTDGSALTQLTHDARVNWFPHCSPDGQCIAYLSFPTGTLGHPADKEVIIRTMKPDGSEQRDIDQFNGGQGSINVNSWSPDSAYFAYVRYPFYE